ncbi:alpha/beta hydrolase fold protein, partial [Tanacetum coccineum]
MLMAPDTLVIACHLTQVKGKTARKCNKPLRLWHYAWNAMLDTAEAMAPDYDPETRVSLNKFVDQLPSVFNQTSAMCLLEVFWLYQVAQGISEFKPTPTENRECCKNSYNVPKTLLVK